MGINTTLCYIEQEGAYLLLHRIKKKNDVNKNKWIGIGGKFEEGESPEECLYREVKEETGLELASHRFHGVVTFCSDNYPTEYMYLYTATAHPGELLPCNEGELAWVKKTDMWDLPMWEGDCVFLDLIEKNHPPFSLKLVYHGDVLAEVMLDGKPIQKE